MGMKPKQIKGTNRIRQQLQQQAAQQGAALMLDRAVTNTAPLLKATRDVGLRKGLSIGLFLGAFAGAALAFVAVKFFGLH